MRIDQLYYLVEVAKNKSITLTAERIYVSQPTLSESLKNLENELGVKLFERCHQGIYLTDIGEKTVEMSNQILLLIDNLKDEIKVSQNTKSLNGSMVLYTVPSISHSIIPAVLGNFYKFNPAVTITVVEAGLNEILTDIEEGKGELGLIVSTTPIMNIDFKSLQYEHLIHDKLYVLAKKSSPLSNKKSVTLKELLNYPLVIHDLNKDATLPFKGYGEPHILLRCNNIATCFNIISQGLAIGFISNMMLNNYYSLIDKSDIVLIPVKDKINYSYGWVYSKNSELSELAKEFIKTTQMTLFPSFASSPTALKR